MNLAHRWATFLTVNITVPGAWGITIPFRTVNQAAAPSLLPVMHVQDSELLLLHRKMCIWERPTLRSCVSVYGLPVSSMSTWDTSLVYETFWACPKRGSCCLATPTADNLVEIPCRLEHCTATFKALWQPLKHTAGAAINLIVATVIQINLSTFFVLVIFPFNKWPWAFSGN